jgi:murein L,D-transpeptidase YcbB/YkuD
MPRRCRRASAHLPAAVLLCLIAVLAAPAAALEAPTGQLLAETLRHRIEAAGRPPRLAAGGTAIHAGATLARFYVDRAFEPAWQDADGWRRAARALADAIRASERQGLEPSDYHLAAIEAALAGPPPADPARRVDLELALTDAYLLLASHYLAGRLDPETIDPEWIAARRGADLAAHLESTLEEGRVQHRLESLLPAQPGYGALVDLLARYRVIEAQGAPPRVPEGAKLEPGVRDPRVAALRARLSGAGGPAAEDPELFDDALAAQLRRFQETHGLEPDAVVGPATLAELNRTPTERIRQIRVNLERWRWLPEDLGRRHVLVNIAGFRLQAVQDGEPVLESRVIVGRQYRRTPVFSDAIRYLVLNPSWDVPRRIAVADKLPLFRKDPEAVNRGRFLVLDGQRVVDPATLDWGALDASSFPYRLRQQPGPQNALGRVKLMFPNRFNVYLHDTPDRHLFERGVRTFSSGCIRVEKPIELSAWVLEETPGWARDALEAGIEAGRERTVPLKAPVPVHILYWTAWIDPDGRAQFRPDVYGRDARVAAALERPAPAP